MKTINLDESVYALCAKYPEIKEIMASLGFSDITKPGMLQSAGRFMTPRKGAALRKISLDALKQRFEEEGFEVEQP